MRRYEEVTCPECGVCFALEKEHFDLLVASRRFFWCPNAHNMRLGLETPQEQQIRALELGAAEQGKIIVAQRAEISTLRRHVIDAAVGSATAIEAGERTT